MIQNTFMNIVNNIGPSKAEKIIISFEISFVAFEKFAAKIIFNQFFLLNHGPHGTIHNQDSFLKKGS